jgi:flavin-dependent dehydrogenase
VTEHVPPVTQTSDGTGPRRQADDADVIVVGAGPAGSTTAYYLAQAGLDVLMLEKSTFPREKVCGDGLTPRGVRALVAMGISVSEQDGWVRNKGLRVIGAGKRLELPWPELSSYPGYGLVRPRTDLDQMLARRAQQAGARLLEGVTVTGPVFDERSGRLIGVVAKEADGERTYRARVIVAAWRCGPTTRVRGTTTTTWSPGWTCGTATGCCRVTAGSSAWVTGRPTWGWGC